jgi:hypothetical protein
MNTLNLKMQHFNSIFKLMEIPFYLFQFQIIGIDKLSLLQVLVRLVNFCFCFSDDLHNLHSTLNSIRMF